MRPPTLLYLDFDGHLPSDLMERITAKCALWRWPLEAVRIDRTRRGWHVIIGIRKRIAALSMVAAQAILGSDPNREAFNLVRVRRLPMLPARAKCQWNVLYSSHKRRVFV